MNKVYRSSFFSNPKFYFVLLCVAGITGFYFDIRVMRSVFLASCIPLVNLFINNLYPQVLKLVYDEANNTLILSFSKYLFINKTLIVVKDQLSINNHDYPMQFGKPIEIMLTTPNGTVVVLNTKFWERKQLKKILKEVWQIDVNSTKPSLIHK